jgi:hypothetical protein
VWLNFFEKKGNFPNPKPLSWRFNFPIGVHPFIYAPNDRLPIRAYQMTNASLSTCCPLNIVLIFGMGRRRS